MKKGKKPSPPPASKLGTPKDIPTLYIRFLNLCMTDAGFRQALIDLEKPPIDLATTQKELRDTLTTQLGLGGQNLNDCMTAIEKILWTHVNALEVNLHRVNDKVDILDA